MISIDSLTFDETGYVRQPQEDESALRVWLSPEGVGVGLYFFKSRLALKADLDDIEGLRREYRAEAEAAGAGVVEIDAVEVDRAPAVLTIFKSPQTNGGTFYVGSVTVPFRDFSFLLRIQCEETPPFGKREHVMVDELTRAGQVAFSLSGDTTAGFWKDPYGGPHRGRATYNLGENHEYDARFPDHPLSKVRRTVSEIALTLRLSDDARASPPFEPMA